MGASSSTVTAGIKNQVDGRSNAIYQLADVTGNGVLADIAKESVKSKDPTELDVHIKTKVRPFLYNGGDGAELPIHDVIAQRHKERHGTEFSPVGQTPSETALHMGIVNENAEMVRFLLKAGADVSQRCSGNFFTCDDQKNSREDKWDSEHAILSRHSSYTGHLYWGEYPLAFAACLSQVACFRMLCAHGADPNWQDSNLNTVLHICTIRQNWTMFELALSQGANLHILNRQGLTPLTLAAYLARKQVKKISISIYTKKFEQMFEHIVEVEREVHWTYGAVKSAAYPLEHLDSIEPSTGKLNRNSALAIIVYGNSTEHLSLLPHLLERLVHRKWETYGIMNLPHVNYNKMTAKSLFYTILNLMVVICATLYLLQMRSHIRNVGKALYFLSLSGFPAKSIFLVSCALMLIGFIMRLFCLDEVEDIIWIITVLLTALKFLYFCRGFKSVGPFVLMLYKIIIRDLIRFFMIYCIIMVGFSQSFYIIFLGYRRNDKDFDIEKEGTIMYNVGETFIRMFIMSLTEFAVLFEQLELCDLNLIGRITFIIYMLLVTMLLINMLIAMMTNTYTEVSANSLEWLRQWSAIVLMMEQSFDAPTRLKYQRQYSIPMDDGKRIALLLKLRMSEEEQEAERQKLQLQRKMFREDNRRVYRPFKQ
uniref:Ion transport domain-containing protein n=1 Tax=Panagrolaimus superbus TaxID=310955 RepID=A0A914YDM3_9BILA